MTYDDDPAQPFLMCAVVLFPFVVYVLSNWQAYSSAGGGVDLEETHKVARSREINVGGGFGDFDDDEDRLFGNEFDDDLYVHIRDSVLRVLWSLTHSPSHYSNDMALGDDNANWLALTTQPASRPSTAPSVGSRAQDSSSVAGSYTSSHGRRHHRLSFRSRKVRCGVVSLHRQSPALCSCD